MDGKSEPVLNKEFICSRGNIKQIIGLWDSKGRNCVLDSHEDNIEVWTWGSSENGEENVYVKLEVPKKAHKITPCSLTDKSNYLSRISFAKVVQIIGRAHKENNEYQKDISFPYKRPDGTCD